MLIELDGKTTVRRDRSRCRSGEAAETSRGRLDVVRQWSKSRTARSFDIRSFRTRRGPRSRRPLGVGDVAGERGDRASDARGDGSRDRTGRMAGQFFDPEIEWHDVARLPKLPVSTSGARPLSPCRRIRRCLGRLGHRDRGHRAAGDRVVARIRYRGVGRLSGAPIQAARRPRRPALSSSFERVASFASCSS